MRRAARRLCYTACAAAARRRRRAGDPARGGLSWRLTQRGAGAGLPPCAWLPAASVHARYIPGAPRALRSAGAAAYAAAMRYPASACGAMRRRLTAALA